MGTTLLALLAWLALGVILVATLLLRAVWRTYVEITLDFGDSGGSQRQEASGKYHAM